ncbi:hypothetical protein KKE06_02945 [Candidatus Micrarchaeota archaeon]|nr:hypothetical protein [Candidatus Micrarchaeota archaeon]MBU1930997.1 hypothetical protein [Candidatus Micrarchaeota archaeon]
MLWLERDNILFALVDTRPTDFKGMNQMVRTALRDASKRPLIIVFPELVFGGQAVERNATEEWIKKVYPQLEKHGNAHIFFSVLENLAPINKRVSPQNTGYLIGPRLRNKKNKRHMYWKRYVKIGDTVSSGLKRRILRLKKVRNERFAHGFKRVPQYVFPSTIINGKRVELRVCSDSGLPSYRKSEVIVIPARGLEVSSRSETLNALTQNGFAIVHDIRWPEKPKTTILKKNQKVEVKPSKTPPHSKPKQGPWRR